MKENFPDAEVPLLHFRYCSAHALLSFHSEVDSNLQQLYKAEGVLNNIKESRAVKTIRRVWELFGPGGDERNGRREDWLAYMKLMDKTSNIISYRANRFNNLFLEQKLLLNTEIFCHLWMIMLISLMKNLNQLCPISSVSILSLKSDP